MPQDPQARRQRIRYRIRKKVVGSAHRPRLCLYKSNRALYAQLIDDSLGHTLVAADSKALAGPKLQQADALGTLIAQQAASKKITRVVFDRSGYPYHGIIQAFSHAARQGGLTH